MIPSKNQKAMFKQVLYSIIESTLSLLYPPICSSCSSVLIDEEQIVCLACLHTLTSTNKTIPDDTLLDMFKAMYPCQYIGFGFRMTKGSIIRKLIQTYKYDGQKEIGAFLGNLLANKLALDSTFLPNKYDFIIPMPLHPNRERTRGFNQCTLIAEPIAQRFSIELNSTNCLRIKDTASQTQKSKEERLNNIKGVFQIADPEQFFNKNILILDDVITTGATLETLCATLSEVKVASIDIISVARK
ncbi:MAG: ComF family protein [Cyclobacteriaceae bacterium]